MMMMMMIGNSADHLLNNFFSHRSDGVWYNNLEATIQYSYTLLCNRQYM